MNISAEPGGPALLRPRGQRSKASSSSSRVKSRPIVCYINTESNSEDVQRWLVHKGFSSKVRQLLTGRSADELFRMSGQTLEKIIGRDEGYRLHSQLTVAKNLTGFTIGRSYELENILKIRKRRTETRRDQTDVSEVDNVEEHIYSDLTDTKISNIPRKNKTMLS